MRKILQDGREVTKLENGSLPMIIHGKEGSGASLYTICLAAKWFTQGNEVLFLCGYPMAEEEFEREVGITHENAKFYTKDNVKQFISAIKSVSDNTVIFVKNIELFDDNLLSLIDSKHNIAISGDIENSRFKSKLLTKTFTTEIYFSPLDGKNKLPTQKYEGCIISGKYKGITKLQSDRS